MHSFTVGVFDSGVGGLSVLYALSKKFPRAKFYYLGDNGNAPYGEKTEEEIFALALEGCKRLVKKRADVIVLACNTVTTCCIGKLRALLPVPLVGTEPALLPAARECKRVLLLATPATVNSARVKEIVARFPEVSFTLYPCPRLAAEIERGDTPDLSFLPRDGFDGVVLGCTHYVLIGKAFRKIYSCKLYDGNEGVAKQVARYAPRPKRFIFPEKGKNRKKFPLLRREEKTNKCSCFLPRKRGLKTFVRIKFLGKYRKINRKRYKHMFELSSDG